MKKVGIGGLYPDTGRQYMENGEPINVANKIGEMLGQDGSAWITATTVQTPSEGKVFICIEAVADTVISATNVTGNMTNLAGKTLKDGKRILGRWTSFKIDSGACIAYEGV